MEYRTIQQDDIVYTYIQNRIVKLFVVDTLSELEKNAKRDISFVHVIDVGNHCHTSRQVFTILCERLYARRSDAFEAMSKEIRERTEKLITQSNGDGFWKIYDAPKEEQTHDEQFELRQTFVKVHPVTNEEGEEE